MRQILNLFAQRITLKLLQWNNRPKNIPEQPGHSHVFSRWCNSITDSQEIQFRFKAGYLNRVSVASALCVRLTPSEPWGAVWAPSSQQGKGRVKDAPLWTCIITSVRFESGCSPSPFPQCQGSLLKNSDLGIREEGDKLVGLHKTPTMLPKGNGHKNVVGVIYANSTSPVNCHCMHEHMKGEWWMPHLII